MAYDVQRFNERTKQMSAYAHLTRPEHGARAAARARRRQQLQSLVDREASLRFNFRGDQLPPLLIALKASRQRPSSPPGGRPARCTPSFSTAGAWSCATSGCGPASTPGTAMAATASPGATPTGGGYPCRAWEAENRLRGRLGAIPCCARRPWRSRAPHR